MDKNKVYTIIYFQLILFQFGRQKTQVYRGPNQPVKGGYEYFAPWGYYNTQPADLPPYH